MIGATLGFYLARHFLRSTFLIFLMFLLLIMAVDMVELFRSIPRETAGTSFKILQVALFRVPSFAQHVIPFSILFGAIISLMALNRNLELVIARAAGASVWQFLLPHLLTAAFLGIGASLIYHPISLAGLKASQAVEAQLRGRVRGNFSNNSRNFWIRIAQEDGDAIVRAAVSEDGGTKLSAVSVYRFSKSGAALERIDAESAAFTTNQDGKSYYELKNAIISLPGKAGVEKERISIPLQITAAELQINTTSPDSIDFWSLGEQAERARASGRNYLQFLTRRQALMSQPLLFAALVLLAACVSLTFTRFGHRGTLILGGVLAGFVLYVASVIVLTFGSNGLVSPVLAAWSPAFVATLIGITILLHQEDG